jgi:hypothetical protein
MTEISHDVHTFPTQRPPFWLDDELVDALVEGRIDGADEERLARLVAPLVPAHRSLPNHTVGAIGRVTHHLGGASGVLTWLDRFPGEPRVVARLVRLGDVLEALSDDPAVLHALARVRESTLYPPGLAGHIVEATDETVLASLAHDIEHLAGEGRLAEAVDVGVGAVGLLEQVLPLAAQRDPALATVAQTLPSMRAGLTNALG